MSAVLRTAAAYDRYEADALSEDEELAISAERQRLIDLTDEAGLSSLTNDQYNQIYFRAQANVDAAFKAKRKEAEACREPEEASW